VPERHLVDAPSRRRSLPLALQAHPTVGGGMSRKPTRGEEGKRRKP
jgi:hypothetical protein